MRWIRQKDLDALCLVAPAIEDPNGTCTVFYVFQIQPARSEIASQNQPAIATSVLVQTVSSGGASAIDDLNWKYTALWFRRCNLQCFRW